MKTLYFLIALLLAHVSTAYNDTLIDPKPVTFKSLTTMPKTTKTITLPEAVKLALQHRPEIGAAQASVREQQAKKSGAWAEYLPKIGIAHDTGTVVGNLGRRHVTEIRGDQLVYHFAGPQIKTQLIDKNISIQEYAKEIIINKIRLAVEQAFISCWMLQQQQPLKCKLNQSTKASFEKSAHENRLQLLDQNDWLKKSEDRALTIFNLKSYENDVNFANKNFAFLTGQALNLNLLPNDSDDTQTVLQWDKTPNETLPSLESCYTQGLANRPEIKQALKQIELEQVSADIARRSILPEFAVNAGAWHNDRATQIVKKDGRVVFQKNFNHIGGTLHWPFFDGTIAKWQEQQALARKINASLTTEQVKQSIKLEIETAYYQLSTSLASFTAGNSSFLRTKSEFLRKKQEYNLNLVSQIDFDLAEATWLAAEFFGLTLVTDIALKRMALDYACGYPKEAIV